MFDTEILSLIRSTMLVVMKIAFPVLAAGVLVGLTISIVQSVTQVQEQTLSIVPKIFSMMIVAALLLPWIAIMVGDFARLCFELVTPI